MVDDGRDLRIRYNGHGVERGEAHDDGGAGKVPDPIENRCEVGQGRMQEGDASRIVVIPDRQRYVVQCSERIAVFDLQGGQDLARVTR